MSRADGLLIAVTRQSAQLLDVAVPDGKLSQPGLGLLVTVIRQPV